MAFSKKPHYTARMTMIHTAAHLAQHAALLDSFFTEFVAPDNFPHLHMREEPGVFYRDIAEQSAPNADPNGIDCWTYLLCAELAPVVDDESTTAAATAAAAAATTLPGETPAYASHKEPGSTDDISSALLTPPAASMLAGPYEFAGGMIVEYYPASACALLAYLFVRKSHRGPLRIDFRDANVGGLLLQRGDALPHLVQHLRSHHGRFEGLFLESNHPSRTPMHADIMPPHKRLGFYRRMGARCVPFDYVLASLHDGDAPADYLLLACLPQFQADPARLPIAVLMRFLVDFTHSSDQALAMPRYAATDYVADLERTDRIDAAGAALEPFAYVAADGRRILDAMYRSLLSRELLRETDGARCVRLTHLPHVEEAPSGGAHSGGAIDATRPLPLLEGAPGQLAEETFVNVEGDLLPIWLCFPDTVELAVDAEGAPEPQCALEADTVDPASLGLSCFGRVQLVPACLGVTPGDQSCSTFDEANDATLHTTGSDCPTAVALPALGQSWRAVFSAAEGARLSTQHVTLRLATLNGAGEDAARNPANVAARTLIARRVPGAAAPAPGVTFIPLPDFLFGKESTLTALLPSAAPSPTSDMPLIPRLLETIPVCDADLLLSPKQRHHHVPTGWISPSLDGSGSFADAPWMTASNDSGSNVGASASLIITRPYEAALSG